MLNQTKGQRPDIHFRRHAKKLHIGPAHYFRVAPVRHLALILISTLVFTSCTTATYKSNLPAGPAKPASYPIPIYTEEMKVPRPCKVIGTISFNPGGFTMFGGSSEAELGKVMRKAYEEGADAVKLTATERPDFSNPNYRLTADLLRYADIWETVAIPSEKFQAYLNVDRQNLDPIEGLWYSDGANPLSIGIVRNSSQPGRDFVGFLLNSNNPAWPDGFKKMDIRHGLAPGSYIIIYYLNDFAPREIPVILGQQRSFALMIQDSEDRENIVTFTKIK
jgi:hypothetical protein